MKNEEDRMQKTEPAMSIDGSFSFSFFILHSTFPVGGRLAQW